MDSNVKLEWLDETVTYIYENNNGTKDTVVCPMRDWPDDIKVKLDNLAGALDRGLELCQDIMDDKELNKIGGGYADWLEERLIKAYGALDSLVYYDLIDEEEFEDEEELDEDFEK